MGLVERLRSGPWGGDGSFEGELSAPDLSAVGTGLLATPQSDERPEVPPAARTGEDPVAALIRRNRLRGIRPAYDTASSRYERDDDVPWAVTAAALEAIDPWD